MVAGIAESILAKVVADKHEKGDRTLYGLDHFSFIADFEFTMNQLIFNKNDEKAYGS